MCACGGNSVKSKSSFVPKTILEKVDDKQEILQKNISGYNIVATIDHHRMAKETGVYTPPSIVNIFSDPNTDVMLVQNNQLLGLDLPFKILSYAEVDTLGAKIAYTSAEFIQKRHNLETSVIEGYKSKINELIKLFPSESIVNTDVSSVNKGFGIVSIKSDFDYMNTINRLKDVVMSQGDTKWFGELDYKKEAISLGLELNSTILLLFGGPAPGGKAMVNSPKIGLDAFCQKLLVYETDNGEVWVAYNDIVAFAELYYKQSTKPQQMINKRLKMTFTKAVKK